MRGPKNVNQISPIEYALMSLLATALQPFVIIPTLVAFAIYAKYLSQRLRAWQGALATGVATSVVFVALHFVFGIASASLLIEFALAAFMAGVLWFALARLIHVRVFRQT